MGTPKILLASFAILGFIALCTGNSKFTNEVYEKTLAEKFGNIILSPLSLETALSLAYMGAKGETAEEMATVLHFENTDPSAVAARVGGEAKSLNASPSVTIANKIYVRNGLSVKPQFRRTATDFDSEIESINFSENKSAAKKINEWVERKTHDKIKDLIDAVAIDAATKMVLVNAIHFKANWVEDFPTYRTRPADFWVSATEKNTVDMMHVKANFKYATLPSLHSAVIELPYENSDLSMLIILPDEKTGLATLEAGLADLNLSELSKNMRMEKVELSLPKFKVEFEMKMKKPLQSMGLKKMFTPAADFSNFLQNQSVQVSEVVHKTFIEVDEKGTEAAAATSMFMVGSAAPGPPMPVVEFTVDRPFYYQIRDSNDNQLFVGSVRNISK